MEESRQGVTRSVGCSWVVTKVCYTEVEELVVIINTLLAVLDWRTGVLGKFEHGWVAATVVRELYFVRAVSLSPSLTERFNCVLETSEGVLEVIAGIVVVVTTHTAQTLRVLA